MHYPFGSRKDWLNRFKRAGQVLSIAAALIMASPIDALACTQIYMGPGTTDTGNVYVGRSEDYANRHAKVFGVQDPVTNPTFTSDECDFNWTYSGTTHRYTYVRDTADGWDDRTDAYSEAGTNDAGVSVSATLTTNANRSILTTDPLVDAGIGEYSLTDVLLGCSDSARDGVRLLGSIIDEHGNFECNQIIIADNTETWIFMQLSGHQWLAVNATASNPNSVSVNPNMGNLKFNVALDDETVCLHSADLEKTAVDAGTATYFEDGTLDVATSYGRVDQGSGQNDRYYQGHNYFGDVLTEDQYTTGRNGISSLADPELFFSPNRGAIDVYTALRSYCARGEGTTFDANVNEGFYAIGNPRTVETHMFQIRQGMSADIATIQWEALSRCEFSVFIPSYSALLTEVDTAIYPTIDTDWDTGHFSDRRDSVAQALDASTDNGSLDGVVMDINTMAYNNRSTMAANTATYLEQIQKQLIAQQGVADQLMQSTPADQRTNLANELHKTASQETFKKLEALRDEMRAFINNGAEGEFVPSDLDAQTGTMKTPLPYATHFVAPEITAQPQGASYEVDATAADLTIEATIPDNAQGSDASLSYAWYEKAGSDTNVPTTNFITLAARVPNGAADRAVGTGKSLPVSTENAGEKSYYCVVTNDVSGLSATSDVATIKVAKKEAPKPSDNGKTNPSTPDNKGNAGQNVNVTKPNAAKVGKGKLAQTSDPTVPMLPVAIAVVGVAAIGAAVATRRKNH